MPDDSVDVVVLINNLLRRIEWQALHEKGLLHPLCDIYTYVDYFIQLKSRLGRKLRAQYRLRENPLTIACILHGDDSPKNPPKRHYLWKNTGADNQYTQSLNQALLFSSFFSFRFSLNAFSSCFVNFLPLLSAFRLFPL